ncbi:MAG: twin-arginine translocation signal domain-containing protein [Deltaproteobacteria bacterium]|nr:twin-arginine translocation signal domain-containing protein [Deltaproteobacteria bacterium]
MKEMNRRDFVKQMAIGGAVLGIGGGVHKQFETPADVWAVQIEDSESATHGVEASEYHIVDTYGFPHFKLIQL